MGTLLFNIGQCGNQIGLQLLDYLSGSSDLYEQSYLRRSEANVYHSLHIDTQPKILKSILENRKNYSFVDPNNILFYQSGRGNNWGLGYMDSKKAKMKIEAAYQLKTTLDFNKFAQNYIGSDINKPQNVNLNLPEDNLLKENSQLLDQLIQMARKEIEKTDFFLGVNMTFSLGGGTGSGVGSRLIEEFRDIFSDITILSTVVFPSKTGENTLQHYNCALSLSQLQTYSDYVIYFQNDKVNSYLNYTQSQNINKVVQMGNLNQYMASCLMNLFRVSDYTNFNRFYFDLLSEVAPLEDFKFLQLYSSPYIYDQSTNTGPESNWDVVLQKTLGQINIEDSYTNKSDKNGNDEDQEDAIDFIAKNRANEKLFSTEITPQTINLNQESVQNKPGEAMNNQKHTTLSSISVFRSNDVSKTLQTSDSMLSFINKRLTQVLNPVKWNPDAIAVEFAQVQLKHGLDMQSVTTIANRSNIATLIQEINEVAYGKYKANAYLHWYHKYGVEKEDFLNSFSVLDNICENYFGIM